MESGKATNHESNPLLDQCDAVEFALGLELHGGLYIDGNGECADEGMDSRISGFERRDSVTEARSAVYP